MNLYEYNDLRIEVSDDPTYKVGSADNKTKYSKHYFGDGAKDYPTSKHSIKIFKYDELQNDCIIIGSGGATGVQKESSLISDDEILVCCCNTVFCLSIDDLQCKWLTRADQATCFGIYVLGEHYITHGEIEISKLDKSGNIVWQFGGSDTFVSFDEDNAFKLNADNIELKDFYGVKYKIDFDGNVLWSSHNNN